MYKNCFQRPYNAENGQPLLCGRSNNRGGYYRYYSLEEWSLLKHLKLVSLSRKEDGTWPVGGASRKNQC